MSRILILVIRSLIWLTIGTGVLWLLKVFFEWPTRPLSPGDNGASILTTIEWWIVMTSLYSLPCLLGLRYIVTRRYDPERMRSFTWDMAGAVAWMVCFFGLITFSFMAFARR